LARVLLIAGTMKIEHGRIMSESRLNQQSRSLKTARELNGQASDNP